MEFSNNLSNEQKHESNLTLPRIRIEVFIS